MDAFFENYSILKSLGNQKKRKFGEVFLVHEKETSNYFVLKRIIKTPTNSSIVSRLRKEATFNFQQKGLPSVKELIETNEQIILLKSFIPGETLDLYWKKIKRKNRIDTWKKIMDGLSESFNTLKDQGIVHCDIKPSNILIEEDGNTFHVHILDFGMAIRMSDIEITPTLFPLGYAAPELILNHLSSVDHTTDLFSLGIISWQLFDGKIPLSHPNPSIFTNLQITYPLPNSSNLPKGLFPILSKMCFKHSFSIPPNQLLIKEVELSLKNASKKRYQSLPEIINEFEKIDSTRNLSSFVNQLIKVFSKTKIKRKQ